MRSLLGWVLVAGLTISTVSPARAQAEALSASVGSGLAISSFFSGAKDLVKQIEDSASRLLDQGDIIAARQQSLLASMLSSAIIQMEKSYANSLNLTFDKLNQEELATFRDLASTIEAAQTASHATLKDIQDSIYQTQTGLNQVLDRLPLVSSTPVVLGITSDDLLNPDTYIGRVTILGYHLVDDKNDRKLPSVTINGVKLADGYISVLYDRVTVSLPDELAHEIVAQNNPCNPPKPYTVALTAYSKVPRWKVAFIPIGSKEVESTFANVVEPFAARYSVIVTVDFEGRLTKTTQTVPFSVPSNSLSATRDGEEHQFYAEYNCPTTAKEINAAAHMHLTNSDGDQCSAVVVGWKASAKGSVKAQHENMWAGHFPGRTWGYMSLDGTYKIDVETKQAVPNQTLLTSVLKGSGVSAPVSELNGAMTAIHVKIYRLGCKEVYDTIEGNLPANLVGNLPITSAKGDFKAVVSAPLIVVSKK